MTLGCANRVITCLSILKVRPKVVVLLAAGSPGTFFSKIGYLSFVAFLTEPIHN